MRTLLENCKVTRLLAATTSGTGDYAPGEGVDMNGWHSVLFFALVGQVGSLGVVGMRAQISAVANSGFTDIRSSEVQLAPNADNGIVVLEVHEPALQFVRPVLQREAASIEPQGIVAVQFNPVARNQPHGQEFASVPFPLAALSVQGFAGAKDSTWPHT